MPVQTAVTSDVDLFSDEIMIDPYPFFAEIREQAAVVHLRHNDVWALTRYEDLRGALADWETFSSTRVAFNDTMNQVLQGTSLATDPPDHTALRAALTRNLTPRALRPHQADIDAKADAMVERLVQAGSFDAIDDLARALPLLVVSDLIGVQGEARENILRWGDAAFNSLGPENDRFAQAFPVAGEFFQWAYSVQATDLMAGSMGRAIFDAGERGEIPRESCGKIIHQYVAAGMDTTIASIGNALYQFARHPEQLDAIRADESLIPSAFNEVLRYESPLHAQGRHVTTDIEIDGTVIPAGAQLALVLGSGNRDPRHYRDPDTFDIRRNPVDHLSFGYATHGCAGQGLARLEAYAVIRAVARRVRRFEIGEPVRKIGNTTRSLDRLPVLGIELV